MNQYNVQISEKRVFKTNGSSAYLKNDEAILAGKCFHTEVWQSITVECLQYEGSNKYSCKVF